jgi:cysteine-rich repeat protein
MFSSNGKGIRVALDSVVVLAALSGLWLAGCSEDECRTSSDCPNGMYCVGGSCRDLPGADADADGDADNGPDADADGDADADSDGDADVEDVDDGGSETDGPPPDCDNDGTCDTGETCLLCPADCGTCPPPDCGNGICETGVESCFDCPADCPTCPAICGNGACETGESCGSCAVDCTCTGCGDGSCATSESCTSCWTDCGTCPDACGDGHVATSEECDDGNTTAGDGCEPDCTFTCHNDAECPDDANVCTVAGICDPSFHTCLYLPGETDGTICDPGNPCTGVGSCLDGVCVYSAPRVCDDGLPCTADACDPATGECSHVAQPEGAACDDGMFCLTNDVCTSWGGCVGGPGPDTCNDGDSCTSDSCNESTDSCVHVPLTTYPVAPCDATYAGSTLFARSQYASHTCPDGSHSTPGNDDVFQVDVTAAGTLTISASGSGGLAHWYIVSNPCVESSCLAHGAASASVTVPSAGTYYVIVETETAGAWAADVNCP